MSANENEIVWTDSSWRVVRASHGALYVERERLDAMRVKTWVHADVDEQMGTLSRCVSALHDRVKKAEAGLERFREVVEAKLPEYGPGVEDWRAGPVGAEGVRLITEMTRELAMAMSVPLPVSWAELITKAAELEQSMGKRCVCCGAPPSHHPNEAVGCDAFAERRWKDESKAKPRCLYRHEAGADLCQLEAGHDGFGHPALSRTTSLEQASIASLRAELTALGKHVEDVERRAYASPTNDALTVELGHNINAPPGQIITTGERLDSLERRVSDNTDALALWQGAVDRLAAKVDAAVELGAKRWSDLGAIVARLGELGEADQKRLDVLVVGCVPPVPSMTLKEAAEMMGAPHKPQTIAEATLAQHRGLSQDVEPLEIAAAMCGRRGAPKVPGFYQGLDVSTSGPITFPVVGVQPVALRPSDDDPRDRAELLEELLAARLGSGNPSAPFDLATLRVPTSETDGTVVLIAEDGRLVITDDVGNNVGVAQLPPTSARLLARMLMQSADAEEAKGASPQAYEPDSEDGS